MRSSSCRIPMFVAQRQQIVGTGGDQLGYPAIYHLAAIRSKAGGLIFYGADYVEAFSNKLPC